jgi:putative membrane protein
MRRSVPILVSLTTILALAALPALASQDSKGRLGAADEQFLRDALQGVMIQADISRLARERSENDHVKRFAEEIVGGLNKLEEDLRTRAESHGIEVASKANKGQKRTDERLSKLEGGDFDVQFMSEQVATLQSLVDMFDREVKKGENASLKEFAQRKGQDLRERLDRAKALYKDVKDVEGRDGGDRRDDRKRDR